MLLKNFFQDNPADRFGIPPRICLTIMSPKNMREVWVNFFSFYSVVFASVVAEKKKGALDDNREEEAPVYTNAKKLYEKIDTLGL